jgi:hypothetical protein
LFWSLRYAFIEFAWSNTRVLNPPTVSLDLVATGGGGPAGGFKP